MSSSGAEQPNIVWITLDSVRQDHTTLTDYERDTTPSLKTIADADGGVSFDHCIAAGNWSLPSTASIHTGTYPSHHRAGYDTNRLPDEVDTVPERLKQVGYTTVGVSANHYFSEATGLDRGFDVFKQLQPEAFLSEAGLTTTLKFLLGIRSHSGGLTTAKSKHRPDYLVNEVVKDQVSELADSDDPFFISAHYHGGHHPYYPPPTRHAEFEESLATDPSAAAETAYDLTTDIHEQIARTDEFSDDDWAALTAMYDTVLSYSDELVGDLFEHIQSLDLDNTVFIVTADHGDLLGEHGLLSHKFLLHDALVRVPMVIHGGADLFESTGELVQHVDIVQTLVRAAGGETEGMQGVDLRSETREYALSQRGADTEESLSQVRDHDPEFDDSMIHFGPLSMLRSESFKYLRSEGRQELFSLPDESGDVSAEYPERTATFERVLEDRLSTIAEADITAEAEEAEFSGAAKERLEELGYLV